MPFEYFFQDKLSIWFNLRNIFRFLKTNLTNMLSIIKLNFDKLYMISKKI